MITKSEFRSTIRDVIVTLPERFRQAMNNIAVLIEDWPDEETMRELDISDRNDLLGVFNGASLIEADEDVTGRLPNAITLYYYPILGSGRTDAEVRAEIRITLLHELGHYFGLDEDRLTELGYD